MAKFRTYTFHILNFVKPDSSFNDGMKPLVYSSSEAEETKVGWSRMGEDVAYYQTQPSKSKFIPQSSSGSAPANFYTLSFKI
jgi:hypothetical protein